MATFAAAFTSVREIQKSTLDIFIDLMIEFRLEKSVLIPFWVICMLEICSLRW